MSGSLTVERTTTHIADNSGRIAMLEVRTQGSDSNALELKRFVYSNHLGSYTLNFFVHSKVGTPFSSFVEKEDLKNAVEKSTIPFKNGDFEVRDKDFPLESYFDGIKYDKPSIMWEFDSGLGPKNSVFNDQHYATKELRDNNNEVQRLKILVYDKFHNNADEMKNYAATHNGVLFSGFSSHHGIFAPWKESISSGPSQFIGTFSADVLLSTDKKSLVFVVTDSKSMYSLFFHTTHLFDQERSAKKTIHTSNTYQKYIFKEPINTGSGKIVLPDLSKLTRQQQ